MIDDGSLIVPHVVVAETTAQAPESPAGETSLPAPTAEQTHTADRLFVTAPAPNPVCSMLGIATSFMLLRDIAVDTFDTSGDEEEEEVEKQGDNDSNHT